ncbi:hypothetical protein DFJ74DRAFT_671910 [Hyaloraphidium curvatum]|nr:hypothetical protein DFJ74DRAFT_671910 [Hyaloraphidium curvatum]
MYGLRHQDYQRYGQYCTRRIHKLRKYTGFLQGKKKFAKKAVEPANAVHVRSLHIVLFQAERCWSQFMLLKRDSAAEPRKKHHAVRKLKKASQFAASLNEICQHLFAEKVEIESETKQKSVLGERASLEAQAYAATMKGFVAFELQAWEYTVKHLTEAREIYEGLGKTASNQREELLAQAAIDAIEPNLKYSLYNLRVADGDESEDVGKLLEMLRGADGQSEMVQAKVQTLLSQKLSRKAHEMTAVEFRKQQIPVRNEKLLQVILRATEAEKLLETAPDSDPANADEKLLRSYESILEAWWEAQALAEGDLREDELATAKVKSSKSAETTTQLKNVLSYVAFCRNMRTVDRDMVLMRGLERKLAATGSSEVAGAADSTGRKKRRMLKKGAQSGQLAGAARREDLVNLWDSIVQNYTEIKNLPFVQNDAALLTVVAGHLSLARANKCLQLATLQSDAAAGLALLARALSFLSSTRSELDSALRRVGKLPTAEEDRETITSMKERLDEVERAVRLERTRIKARAVEAEQNAVGKVSRQMADIKLDGASADSGSKEGAAARQRPLIDRLDTFPDDLVLDPRNPNLVDFPPHFVPVPCKPLFFDLAAGHIEYPLEAIAARGRKQLDDGKKGISGWLGGWFGAKKS